MFKRIRYLIVGFLLFITFFGIVSNINVLAKDPVVKEDLRDNKYKDSASLKKLTTCNITKKSVKIWDLGKVSEFLPIIPIDCALDNDKEIRPLTIAILPDLIIRILGLLFSLAFWLLPLWVILYGFFIIILPFDQGINTQTTVSVATIGKKAAQQALELVAGIVIISISYTIVMTVLRLIGLDNGSVNTDLNNFFN